MVQRNETTYEARDNTKRKVGLLRIHVYTFVRVTIRPTNFLKCKFDKNALHGTGDKIHGV